jgi:hypothetical protein
MEGYLLQVDKDSNNTCYGIVSLLDSDRLILVYCLRIMLGNQLLYYRLFQGIHGIQQFNGSKFQEYSKLLQYKSKPPRMLPQRYGNSIQCQSGEGSCREYDAAQTNTTIKNC